jgi:predicted nucleotidyltransferase
MNKEALTENIIRIMTNNIDLDHYSLFYFGSRVSGDASSRSDIDIGLKADRKIPLHTMSRIKEEIESIPLLQKIDIVDFSRVSDDFRELAEKDKEIFYEQ